MKTLIFSGVTMLSLLLLSCNGRVSEQKVGNDTYGRVDVATAKNLIKSNEVIILDVRTPQEVAEGAISGAVNLDYLADDLEDKLAELDKEKEYLIYCRSGNRSLKTLKLMNEAGIDRVYEIKGGYKAWSEEK